MLGYFAMFGALFLMSQLLQFVLGYSAFDAGIRLLPFALSMAVFSPISTKLVDDIGLETLMWGSDYPHTDGIWPESTKYIEEQFAGLTPDQIHKITCENAAKFYRLSN